jgi:transglutaminase-like putative cysteine protease
LRRALAALAAVLCAALALAGEQRATYRASGADARLFDQYDNDGYSLEVSAASDGSAALSVRVSDGPLDSSAPFPPPGRRDAALPAAPDRDAYARRLTAGSRTEQEAVRRILLGIASEVRYDADRLRLQDPAAVFASRRAYCVGFAELAVDLLRRSGISARTVQGVLRSEPGADRYDPSIGGVYHRWIEVYYPDRGYVFSDPMRSVNGVDANYLPFGKRALARPHDLKLTPVSLQGVLSYDSIPAGEKTLRLRPSR